MKTVTISETEYIGLLETVNRLTNELIKLKSKPKKKTKTGTSLSDKLHGSIKLPYDFDYKIAVEDAILAKHLYHD